MRFLIFISFVLFISNQNKLENPIIRALKSDHPKIKKVTEKIDQHELQIMISYIDEKNNSYDYDFNLNAKNYYYPASTVKFPIALFTLEKINEFPLINIDTPYRIQNDTTFYNIRNDINEIMVMSSNEAYNRLFEFLGQDYINSKLREKGMNNSKIYHRLSTSNSKNLFSKKISFFINDSLMIFDRKQNTKIKPLDIEKLNKGVGYIDNNGNLVKKPMNFSEKNYIPLDELHKLSKVLFHPQNEKKLKLTQDQYLFLKKSMNLSPSDIGYNRKKYTDTYSNFLVLGDRKKTIKKIEIYNKIGFAYGYVSETAFIETPKSSIIISIVMKVNENQIFNDNNYEYEEIAIPFFAEFGREIIDIINSK